MEDQGYHIKSKIYYQDNESAMRLERNGRKSCGDKSRHFHIRYFFIKDVLERENITLLHCPTEDMVADFFTKPLQGSLLKKIRELIMGHSRFPAEERVENSIKTDTRATENLDTYKVRKNVTFADVVRTNI